MQHFELIFHNLSVMFGIFVDCEIFILVTYIILHFLFTNFGQCRAPVLLTVCVIQPPKVMNLFTGAANKQLANMDLKLGIICFNGAGMLKKTFSVVFIELNL